jgi:hypothetical protein
MTTIVIFPMKSESKQPSWRQQGETGVESDLSKCDAFLLMTALRGLPRILNDIAASEQVFFPENVQDLEFVADKIDRLVTELHCRLVAADKLSSKPAQRPNHSGSSDSTKPKEKRRKRLADGTLGFIS